MWNYRIVRHKVRGLTWYGLHEVYYTKKGKPYLWAPNPDATGDSKADLVGGLAMQIRDATRDLPVLDERKMPGAKRKLKQTPQTCEHCHQRIS